MKYLSILASLSVAIIMAPNAHGKAPIGRFVLDAKGETVADKWTNRVWQRAIDGGAYTQAAAKTSCATLALAGGGWRLPDMRELLSIVDRQQLNPAIDPTAFPSTPAATFWSASSSAASSLYAWAIFFSSGGGELSEISNQLRVRCVR